MKVRTQGPLRAFVLILVLLALTGVVAGCGDDDDKDSGSSGSTTEAEAPKQPAALAMVASGDAKDPKYTVPETVPAGVVNIELTNNTKDSVSGQLIRVEGEHSDEEVVAALGNAIEGKPVEDWFVGAGGPGETKEGQKSTVTQVLEPGTYYAVGGGEDKPKGPPAKFTVEPGEVGTHPRLTRASPRRSTSSPAPGSRPARTGSSCATTASSGTTSWPRRSSPTRRSRTSASTS